MSTHVVCCVYVSRVPNQNGISLLYIMLEIHHSDQEPWIYSCQRSYTCFLIKYENIHMSVRFGCILFPANSTSNAYV